MHGSVQWGHGRRDDFINVANFLANIAILYVSVNILNISRNNAGYNLRIMQNTDEINKNLSCRKKEK